MSEKTEERIAYFVIAVMIIASFVGFALPLMNPSYYSKLMPGIYSIPMVQHNIDIQQCENPLLSRTVDIDIDSPIAVFCDKETLV